MVNWAMGRFLAHFSDRRWFPIDQRTYDRAAAWYGRFGVWSLLLAWVPIIGDPLTVVAGMLRVDWRWFVLLVTIGKLGRYLALAAAFAGFAR
jgi:membrane protein YqaA with SNARE-associated domain